MRKIPILIGLLFMGTTTIMAAPVSVSTAQQVATNFFGQVSEKAVSQSNLTYTEKDASGNAVYYVFNINNNTGFVIVSADDILHPIIGYSTEGKPYLVPAANTNADFWMKKRKAEIINAVANKLAASADITNEWTAYINNTGASLNKNTHHTTSSLFPSSTAFLVQSTWDQEAPYFNDCPGTGSNKAVTGCVATAMSQIMRFWQYPATGQSSSNYDDATSVGYSMNYGVLRAKYNHPYAWSTMELTNPTSATDTLLPRIMSDAGISVDMDYSPSGSGAFVITSDDPLACAQLSYVKYFKYYSKILDGLNEFSNPTTWQDTLEHELNCGRPIQYVGSDPVEGGHTWVCDGYDATNDFHMNWGWSGYDDGWYALNNLNPNTLDFSQNLEALIGIMPPPVTAVPKAAFVAASLKGCTGNMVQYMDTSTNQPISWKWSFPGGTPDTSTAQNPTVSYPTAGTYSASLVVTNSLGVDSITKTNYVTINASPAPPTVTLSGIDSLICTPAIFSKYQWYKGSTLEQSGPSNIYVVPARGGYYVEVTDGNGCSVNSAIKIVSTSVGIDEVSLSNYIKAYPNPTSGNLQVIFNLPTDGDYTIAITDMLGQTVYSSKVHLSGVYSKSIDLSGAAKGIYFLSIVGNNSKGVQKIMVY